MIAITKYRVSDGGVIQTMTLPESDLGMNIYTGEAYVEAILDGATHVINGELVIIPPDPPPPPTLEELKEEKIANLASYRYQKEVAGIVVGGMSVRTDRVSQATLTGAYAAAQLNPNILIDWKCSDGSWTQIDKATVESLSAAVANHVQLCFSNEKFHSAAIGLLTVEADVEDYDFTTGWPV